MNSKGWRRLNGLKKILFDKPDDPEKPTEERKRQSLRAIHIILHESHVPSFANMCMHTCTHTETQTHKINKRNKKIKAKVIRAFGTQQRRFQDGYIVMSAFHLSLKCQQDIN